MVTPQGETGHNSLETQNKLWVPDDVAWNDLPNAFYRESDYLSVIAKIIQNCIWSIWRILKKKY